MSSLLKFKDVLNGNYSVVKVDGKLLELKSEDEVAVMSAVEVEEKCSNSPSVSLLSDIVRRFDDYFSRLEVLRLKQGAPEPKELKAIRPFLLANEAVSKPNPKMKMNKKGKSNGKKVGKSSKTGSKNRGFMILKDSIDRIYTQSNPAPAPMLRSGDNLPYRISQFLVASTLFSTSTSINTFGSANFILNNLDNIASFQNLFDQYRISEIEVWLEPNGEFVNSGGFLYTLVDYDDSTVLTSLTSTADFPNVLVSNSTDGHYHRFTPHVAVAAYSGTFTSFTNVAAPWIDTSSPSVQHYGIKAACSVTASSIGIVIRSRYHIEFRNVR